MTFAPPTQPGTRYRVYMTPRTDQVVYGDEIEVTDHVTMGGINQIKRAIDSQDYAIGIYFYSDLELIGANDNGYFNDATDIRSIFKFMRDRTKVRVVYENSGGDSIVYHGLINEEATRLDAIQELITFRVLSRDSVIRNTQVAGGSIPDNATVKTAISNILSNTAISSVLIVNAANINPTVNFTIDLGDAFDGMPTQDALNTLLLFSNSIMTIDDDGTIHVMDRGENEDKDPLNLYGPTDLQKRQNVIDLTDYNIGLQRMFTSIAITDANSILTVVENANLAKTYGYRQAAFDAPFMTNIDTIKDIANALLDQFSAPKSELIVEVQTTLARGVELSDRVSVSWPYRITPYQNHFMPVIGTTKIGNTNAPLPVKSGSLMIPSEVAFKVIEIDEDPSTFTSFLKLRQIGTSLSDGYFNVPTSSIIGFAIIGSSKIKGTGSTDAQWNPSVIGAALIGSTKTA